MKISHVRVQGLRLALARVPVSRVCLIAIILSGLFIARRVYATTPTSVDLSTYVRVGRFDLPEPTRTTPPANSLLAQEASAVTYDWDTDTLFVVGDGGTSVVQVSKTGQLIDSMTLAPGSSPQGTDFYDTEGITYVGGGKFVLIEERYRQANLFTYVAGGTLHQSRRANRQARHDDRKHRTRRRLLRPADGRIHLRQREGSGIHLPDGHRFRCRHRDQRLAHRNEFDRPVQSGPGQPRGLLRRVRVCRICRP